jgi:hypothetical protein
MFALYLTNNSNIVTGFCEFYNNSVVEGALNGTDSWVKTVTTLPTNWQNSYYKNNEFKQLPEKPSNYHIWNLETEQWEEPENYQQLLFNEAAGKVKQERQRLLATTDWTDTVSASTRLENYNEWQFYRQQLRDITTQEGYPFNVEWPTQPV